MRSSDRIEWDLKNEMFQFKTKCHQRGSYCNIGFSLNECQPFIKQVNLKFLLTSFVTLKNYFTSSFYVSLTWEDSINLAIIICNLSTGLKVFWYLLFPRVPPLWSFWENRQKIFIINFKCWIVPWFDTQIKFTQYQFCKKVWHCILP